MRSGAISKTAMAAMLALSMAGLSAQTAEAGHKKVVVGVAAGVALGIIAHEVWRHNCKPYRCGRYHVRYVAPRHCYWRTAFVPVGHGLYAKRSVKVCR